MRPELPEPAGHSLIPILGSLSACTDCGVAQEADHRIANHLAMLAGYVGIKATALQEGPDFISRRDAALMLQAIRSQIHLIARVHRGLIFDDGAAPDLSRHIHEACEPFQATLSPGVQLVEDLPDRCLVTAQQLLPLTQIVAEALTNAIKYARGDQPVRWLAQSYVGWLRKLRNDPLLLRVTHGPSSDISASTTEFLSASSEATMPAEISGLSMSARMIESRDEPDRSEMLVSLSARHPGYFDAEAPDMNRSALIRVLPEVVSIIDFSNSLGHSDLVAVGAA